MGRSRRARNLIMCFIPLFIHLICQPRCWESLTGRVGVCASSRIDAYNSAGHIGLDYWSILSCTTSAFLHGILEGCSPRSEHCTSLSVIKEKTQKNQKNQKNPTPSMADVSSWRRGLVLRQRRISQRLLRKPRSVAKFSSFSERTEESEVVLMDREM